MAQATSTERVLSWFTTPAELSPEDAQRQRRIVRSIAFGVLLSVLLLVIVQAIGHGVGYLLVPVGVYGWIALGLIVPSCLAALAMVQARWIVEGAWLLVLATSTAAALVLANESFAAPLHWPSLSALLLLWPIVVAGASLPNKSVYWVASLNAGFFILITVVQGRQLTDPQQLPAFLLQYGLTVILSLYFVASVAERNAISLQAVLRESEQRAQSILEANQQIMEKSIQQVNLSTQLSLAAVELSATARQQASGSAEQASAISEVTSTIEEMGYTARQIAQSAENVAQVAEQTLEATGRGQHAVDETVSAMEGIKGRVQELADKVLALGEHSQRIGEIMEIINNIADETHLLALNAAIESAGAGEHGRRFAVVAAEVKNLANRAMESAKEVRGIIAEIQRATNASVMAAEEGLKDTERGVEQVYQAGRAMEEIVMLAQRTSEAVQEISLATTQQRTASEQIVETMREIAEVANQTAEGSRQVADAATMLTSIAEQLQTTGQVTGLGQ